MKSGQERLIKHLQNIHSQLLYTFSYWNIRKPSAKTQFYRTTIFLIAILLAIFWPIPNIAINLAIIGSGWLLLSFISKPVYPIFTLIILMLSIITIHQGILLFSPTFNL